MKVGDEVRLSSIGKKDYNDCLNNPHNLTGIIIEYGFDSDTIEVKWSNGEFNSYLEEDLELVNEVLKVGDYVHKFSGSAIYRIKSIEGTTVTIVHNKTGSSYKDTIHNLVLFNPPIIEDNFMNQILYVGEKYGNKYKVTFEGIQYMWNETQIRDHMYFKYTLISKDTKEDIKELEYDTTGLPKYFVIERDESNLLWREYIDWLNKTYGDKWNGDSYDYYGYDGNTYKYNGTNGWDDISSFQNNPTLITLEQWDRVINRHQYLIGIDVGETCGSQTASVEVDYHGNILNTNLGLMSTMNKLNTIRADKFFAQEKNLAAIEKIDETIKDACDLIAATQNELSSVHSKLISLNRKLEAATNEQDVATLKDLIAGTKAIEEFVSELKGKTIAKFETAKTKFNVADFLND